MCGRKRRRSGCQLLTRAERAAERARCTRCELAAAIVDLHRERAAGAAGAATAARPRTARTRARRAGRERVAASASISPTGRLPRKHSVRCSDCASSSRSAPRAAARRARRPATRARPRGQLLAHLEAAGRPPRTAWLWHRGTSPQAMLAPPRPRRERALRRRRRPRRRAARGAAGASRPWSRGRARRPCRRGG